MWSCVRIILCLLLQSHLCLSCDHSIRDDAGNNLATKYMAYLSEFQKLIYPDLPFHPWGTISKERVPKPLPPYTLCYNATKFEYFKTNDLPKDAIEGKAIWNQTIYPNPNEIIYSRSFPEGDPIGYLVYLPQNQIIKGFIIEVYGAAEKVNYDNFIKQPGKLDDFDHNFLHKGWGIVKLNLVDVLDPLPSQHSMPEPYFNHVLDSLGTFVNILGKNPGRMHESLAALSHKPLFLIGQSFGGCMIINYMQKHPGTITGAIVHNSKYLQRSRDTPWINCFNKDFSDFLYIIHPFDDNRTHFEGALSFVKSCVNTSNENFIHLHFIPEGGPHRSNKVIEDSGWNATLKGHAWPQNEEFFEGILEGVEGFLNNPQQPVNKLLNRWILGRWETYYAKDQPIKNFEEDFLSRAMRLVEALPRETRVQLTKVALGHEDEAWFQKLWQEQFQQVLAHSYMMIAFDRNTIYEPFVHAHIFHQLKEQNQSSWVELASKSMKYVLPAFRKYVLERFAEETDSNNLRETPQIRLYFEGVLPQNYRPMEADNTSTSEGKEKKCRDLWKTTLLPYFLCANRELSENFISNVNKAHGNLIKFFENVPATEMAGEEPEVFQSQTTLKEFLIKYPYEPSLAETMQKLFWAKIAERFKETKELMTASPDTKAYISRVFPKGMQQLLLQDIAVVKQIDQ